MKRIFLSAIAIVGLHLQAYAFHEGVSIQVPEMRFYSVKIVDFVPEGRLNLLAAGQIRQKNRNDALIIAFSITNGSYKEIARETFRVGYQGYTGQTRIRSMVCIKETSTNRNFVVVNGKAGPENREIGFIRSYVFINGFKLVDSIEFSNPDSSYTHGYPLIQADIDGNGKNEIIYGGFAGDDGRDHSEILIFSIGENGHLSRIRGPQTSRLDSLRLRLNALTSGDFNGDGKAELVAAGRTDENGIEHGAFALFSDQKVLWKKLDALGSSRYRYATVTDMTGDGHPELILGGRIDQGETSYALLDIWETQRGGIELISRYRFTGAGSTRLRVVKPLPECTDCLIIGGRIETHQNDHMKWKGFLKQMTLKSGVLFPHSKGVILDKGRHTRVRTMDIHGNCLIAAGFAEDKAKKSTAFISVYHLK